MKLSELYENPDNPSKCTEEQMQKLADKLKRVPLGLTAMRIAYVTDKIPSKKMVISGNKRLRVLKKAYGEDAELPDEWFQDVTAMSEAERHEFIVTANVSDGDWDIDKLLEQYSTKEIQDFLNINEVFKVLGNSYVFDNEADDAKIEEEAEIDSQLSSQYDLGTNVVMCGNPAECDEIRKFYSRTFLIDANWKKATPRHV